VWQLSCVGWLHSRSASRRSIRSGGALGRALCTGRGLTDRRAAARRRSCTVALCMHSPFDRATASMHSLLFDSGACGVPLAAALRPPPSLLGSAHADQPLPAHPAPASEHTLTERQQKRDSIMTRFLHANFRQSATSAVMQLVHGSSSRLSGGSAAQRRRMAAAFSALTRASSTSLLAASAMPLLRAAAPFSINAASVASAITSSRSALPHAATAPVHCAGPADRIAPLILAAHTALTCALIVCAPQRLDGDDGLFVVGQRQRASAPVEWRLVQRAQYCEHGAG